LARTAQEQLDAVDAAIQEIEEGAQSVTPGNGKSYTRANIADLYRERARLERTVARAARGGRISVRGARAV
jgi:hypothetical protein